MPISRKRFDAGDFKKRFNANSKEHPVAEVLRKNADKYGYTIKDLQRITKLKEDTIRSKLRNLKKKGLIEHKIPYFAWKINKKKPSKKPSKKKK